MSGFGTEEDLQLSRDAGFLDHLTKPIDLNRLDAVIRRATSGHARRDPATEPFGSIIEANGSGAFKLSESWCSTRGIVVTRLGDSQQGFF